MIPFNRIDNQKYIKPYLKSVERFIKSGNYILDESVDRLERQLEAISGAKHALGVSNGADGLYMALKSLNIGSGDEVITQGTAYNASVTAILRTGAKPRFADIRLFDWKVDPDRINKLINKKTKAFLLVNLYGRRYNAKSSLPIIEDSCQCFPSQSNVDISVYSFYPTKPLGSLGDAGAVITNDEKIYEKLKILRNLGQSEKNVHTLEGYNHRINSLQALFLLEKLKDVDKVNWIANMYDDAFSLKLKIPFPSFSHYHIYPIWVSNRDEFRKKMFKAGIETAVHYPTIVYKQPFWKGKYDKCPKSEKLLEGIVSLPIYPTLKKKEVEYIIKKTLKYANS